MPGGVGAGTLLLVPAGSSVVVGMGVGEDPTIVCCSGPTLSLEYPESSLVPPPVIAFMVESKVVRPAGTPKRWGAVEVDEGGA